MPKRKKYSPSHTWLRALSGTMAVTFIWTNVLFAQRANPSFWEERRNVVAQFTGGETLSSFRIERRSTAQGNSTATTPYESGNYNLLAQLPTLQTSIADRAKNWNSSVSPPLSFNAIFPSSQPSTKARECFASCPLGRRRQTGLLTPTDKSLAPILSSVIPYAEIKEVYSPHLASSPKSLAPVVIIQDVHQHYEAQKNIANVVSVVAQFIERSSKHNTTTTPDKSGNYKPNELNKPLVVGLEGAVGPFDFSPYRAYSDKKLTEDIADFFMRQGMIGGPEFYGITAPDDKVVPMIGVEDEKLYLANIKAFKDSLPLERQVKVEVEIKKQEIKAKKEKLFNSKLLELDRKRETYHESNLGLGEYLTYLASTISRLPSTVFLLVEAYNIEKTLDIAKLESERSQILDILTEKMPKPTLGEILESALAYRTGSISYARFYTYFKETSKSAGINFSQFQEMDKYVKYVQLADSIDKNKLFSEIEQLEASIENTLAKTKEEKELLKESKCLELVKKLVEFSLTPEEWNSYVSLRDNVAAQFTRGELAESIGHRLKHNTATTPDESGNYNEPNELNKLSLLSFEQFYETALKRNETLLSNLFNSSTVAQEHSRTVVLVAGGFHTNGITQLLKQKNIPYVVLAPNITKVEEGQKSLELLARTKTPLEKLFAGEKIFLQSQRLTSNTPSPEFALQAKTFRETYGLLEVVGAQNLEEAQKAAKHTKKFFNMDITDIKFQTHALFSAAWLKVKILPNKIATLIVTWMDSSKKSVAENISSYEKVIDGSTQLLYGEIGNHYMRMGAVKESGLQRAFIAIKSIIQHILKTLNFSESLKLYGKKLTDKSGNSTSTLGLIGIWKHLGLTSRLETLQQQGRAWTVAGLVGVLGFLEEVIFSWGLLQHILPGFLSWAFAVFGFPDLATANLLPHFLNLNLNLNLSFILANLAFGLAHTRLIKWQNGKPADTGKAKWHHRLLFFPLLGAAFRINYVFSGLVPVNPFLLALILHTFHNDVLTRFLSKLAASFKLPAWLSPPLMHIAVPRLNLNDSKYLPKSWVEQNVPALKDKNIVEVTMEMALSNSILKMLESKLNKDEMRAVAMATTVGGIGPLLKERIISQSRYGATVTGVSLLYDNVWVQKISDGTLNLEKVEIGKYLRGIKDPATGKYHGGVLEYVDVIDVEMYDNDIVQVKVWKAPAGAYGGGTVYFLDMPDIANTIWARANVVYPGYKDISEKEDARFRQSWLLGRGTLELMKKLNKTADVVVMSEAPAMFVHHRVFRDKFSNDAFFENTVYIFNDHTPMDYAHPEWDIVTLKKLKVDPIYYDNMPFWNKDGKTDVTALIINTADGAYGVARKHGMVMRMMPLLRQFAEKIQWTTNGVSEAYWPHDELKNAYKVAMMSDAELLAIKDRRREKLIRWLAERQGLGQDWANKAITEGNPIGVWTRRIVDYKRLERLMDILENDKMKEQFLDSGIILVIGGRIHQDDSYGLNQFNRLQSAIYKDPRLRERVIFFENYNIWEAPNLFQGTDLSIMLADDGREAAATGFMKAQMNGALIVASEDGAVPESVVFYDGTNADVANGFNVPFLSNGEPNVDGLLKAFTDFGKVFKDKKSLGKMVRNAIKQTPRVSVNRTAQDMLIFFGNVVTRTAKNKEHLNEGKRMADKIFASLHNGADKSNRFQLNEVEAEIVSSYLEHGINKFLWGYKEWGYHVKPIDLGGPGFNGFAQSVKYILSLGTVGEWSLAFHAHNQNGRGDIITYIEYALNKMLIDLKHTQSESGPLVYEYLVSAINKMEKLGNQAQKTFGTKGKVMLNLKALGLYSGVAQILSYSTDANKAIIDTSGNFGPHSLGAAEYIQDERVIRTVKRREGTKLLKAQLMSINPHEPGKFSDIEFETKVNKSGTIYIKLANVPGKKEKIKATLRTGSERHGIVKISRKWVPEKNEYRVYTRRTVKGEFISTESRIVQHPDYPHLSILNQTYPGEEGLNALAIQLTSKTPHVPGIFPDLDFDDARANDRGQILIYLGQFAGERVNATVSTGATEPGFVKIERFFASLLGKYIMKTTREINGRTIVKFFHIVPFTKHPGLWKWEGFDYDKTLEKAKQLEAIKSDISEELNKTFNNGVTMEKRIKRIFNLSLNMALEFIPPEIKTTGISAKKLSQYYANLTWTQQEVELVYRLRDSIDIAKTSFETTITAGRDHVQAQAYIDYLDSLLVAVRKIIEQVLESTESLGKSLEILKFALNRYEQSVKPDLDLLKQRLLRMVKYQEGFNQESTIRQIIQNINTIKQKYENEINPPLLQLTRDPTIPKDLKSIVEDTLSDFGNGLQHFTNLTIMPEEKAVKYLATPGKLNIRMEGIAHIETAMRKMEQYLQSINLPGPKRSSPPQSAISWINLAAALILVPITVYYLTPLLAGHFGIDLQVSTWQALGLVTGIALVQGLIFHEGGHRFELWWKSQEAHLARAPGIWGGMGFANAHPLSGILSSSIGLAVLSIIYLPTVFFTADFFIAQILIASIATNLIFAMSLKDWMVLRDAGSEAFILTADSQLLRNKPFQKMIKGHFSVLGKPTKRLPLSVSQINNYLVTWFGKFKISWSSLGNTFSRIMVVKENRSFNVIPKLRNFISYLQIALAPFLSYLVYFTIGGTSWQGWFRKLHKGIADAEVWLLKISSELKDKDKPSGGSKGATSITALFILLAAMATIVAGIPYFGTGLMAVASSALALAWQAKQQDNGKAEENDRRVNLTGKIKYSDDIENDYEKSKIQYLLENLEHFPESGLQIERIEVRREYYMDDRKIYEINFIGSAGEILAPPVALKIYEPFFEFIKTLQRYARNSENTANKLAKKNSDIAPKGVRKLIDIDPNTGKGLVAMRKEYIAGSNIEDMIRAAASSEEKHRLAVRGLNAYITMYKTLGYLIADAHPENIIIETMTGQAKIIDFEVPTKKLKEPEVLDLLRYNWEFIFASEDEFEDEFLEAFGEAATQVYGQEASRFLEEAGILPYFKERLQEHLYELKPYLAVLKYLLTIFDEADEARERYIFAMEDNVTKMLNKYREIQSFLNKHVIPEQLETTIEDNVGNVLFSFSLLPPLNHQKLERFKQPLLEEINWIKNIMETHTVTIEKEDYEERALMEMLSIFPTLTPVTLEYISSEFPGITPERIKEMLESARFYTRTGKETATGKTDTYLKPESLGAAVRQVSNTDTERSEDESALRRTIREEMGKIMSETKINLLSDLEPFELKETISELPEEHRGSGNLWYMVRLADFFSAARSERQTRRSQSGPIYKKELSRVLFFMTGEELSELVKVAEDWHDSEQEMDDDSFAAFAEKLFRIQGSSFALAKETGRQEAMDFEQMFSAFGRLTGFIAPEIKLGQELKEKLKPLWEYGTKLPGQLKKSRLLKTRDFIKKDKSWSGVRLFDVSNISEDTLTQMWTNIKMVKGKIAIGVMTDKAVLGKDDIENIKKSLRSRWKNMSDKNRPDFDEMLKSVHFGEIIVTAADLMTNEHVESPLIEINPDVLYKVTRDKAKNLFGNTEQIPVQLFTPNPFRFKLSWKEEAFQILAIVTAIQILEIGNKTEDTIRQIAAASKQA